LTSQPAGDESHEDQEAFADIVILLTPIVVRIASISVLRCGGNRSCSPASLIRSRAPISSQIAALHTRSI
jgi:hypothetical protein